MPSSLTKRRAFWWEQTRGSSTWLPLSTRPRYLDSIQYSSQVLTTIQYSSRVLDHYIQYSCQVPGQYSVLVLGTRPMFSTRPRFLAITQCSSRVLGHYSVLVPGTVPQSGACQLYSVLVPKYLSIRPRYLTFSVFFPYTWTLLRTRSRYLVPGYSSPGTSLLFSTLPRNVVNIQVPG